MPVLPEYITLEEAARRYGIDRETLTQMIESGKIKAVNVEGRIAVENLGLSVSDRDKEEKELVSISEAARRLNLNVSVIWRWYRRGWLPREGGGPNRVILVDYNRACALAQLRAQTGKRGSRLIPRKLEPELLLVLP